MRRYQAIDAVEGKGEEDPEQRGEEDAAENGQQGVGEQEICRCGALGLGGGVVEGGGERRRVHITTSLMMSVGAAIERLLSLKRVRA